VSVAGFNKIWVLEWSSRQATFHIQTVDKMLTRNMETYLQRRNADSDWIVVAVAESRLECQTICQKLKAAFDAGDDFQQHRTGFGYK